LADRIEDNKKQNPDWEYKLWSDDDIIDWLGDKGLNEELDIFKSIAVGPAKADLFRMLILYHEGGFYMDLDNILALPIDDWLLPEAECMVGMNGLRRVDFNICAAVPGNIYIENTLRAIMKRLRDRLEGSALSVTGPCNWRAHNRNNKKNYPEREYRLQLVAPKDNEGKGWAEYPTGQIGTPPKDHWLSPIRFLVMRNRAPWRSLPDDKPIVNWQGCKKSLYKQI
jgi:mannosyltransferase OCH1-like enzyme